MEAEKDQDRNEPTGRGENAVEKPAVYTNHPPKKGPNSAPDWVQAYRYPLLCRVAPYRGQPRLPATRGKNSRRDTVDESKSRQHIQV